MIRSNMRKIIFDYVKETEYGSLYYIHLDIDVSFIKDEIQETDGVANCKTLSRYSLSIVIGFAFNIEDVIDNLSYKINNKFS